MGRSHALAYHKLPGFQIVGLLLALATSVLGYLVLAAVPFPGLRQMALFSVVGLAAAFLTVIANYLAPAQVFEFLLASSGAIALLVYLVIAVSQLRMRQKRTAAGEKIVFKMWLFPGLTYAVIIFIVAALTIMLFQEAHRVEILATGLLSLMVVAAGLLHPGDVAAVAGVAQALCATAVPV